MTDVHAIAAAKAHGFDFVPEDATVNPPYRVSLRGISLGALARKEAVAFARGVAAGLARVRELMERRS